VTFFQQPARLAIYRSLRAVERVSTGSIGGVRDIRSDHG
jgi:hypothetical protein